MSVSYEKRNYIAYDAKSPNQKFSEGLRNTDPRGSVDLNRSRASRMSKTNGSFINNFSLLFDRKNSNLNQSNLNQSNLNQSGLSDLESMLFNAKDRVRSSISYANNNMYGDGSSPNLNLVSADKMKILSQSPIRNNMEVMMSKSSDLNINKGYNKTSNNYPMKKNSKNRTKLKE